MDFVERRHLNKEGDQREVISDQNGMKRFQFFPLVACPFLFFPVLEAAIRKLSR
jgi:hypothetical protein